MLWYYIWYNNSSDILFLLIDSHLPIHGKVTKNNLINVKDLFHEYKENNSQVDIKYFNENHLLSILIKDN